ncbi:MAG: hypothetical protein EPO27_14510 [Betaproteobacteria bacterium]|nr:MAG: hypothetical protein EPO27_14510 [Betaproteobacteria bacterium]
MIREGAIRIPFKYAAGRAGSRFLVALRDGMRIIASRCETCARVAVPLRTFCPACGGDDLAEVEVGPGGTILAWTETPDAGSYALVRLDGADTAFLHRLVAAPAGCRIGHRVRVRFASSRRASILDIDGFEPVTGEAR